MPHGRIGLVHNLDASEPRPASEPICDRNYSISKDFIDILIFTIVFYSYETLQYPWRFGTGDKRSWVHDAVGVAREIWLCGAVKWFRSSRVEVWGAPQTGQPVWAWEVLS